MSDDMIRTTFPRESWKRYKPGDAHPAETVGYTRATVPETEVDVLVCDEVDPAERERLFAEFREGVEND